MGIPTFLLAFMGAVGEAGAFCRSTTCTGDDCPRDADGCPTEGNVVRWGKLPLHYRFHARGSRLIVRDEARAAIRAALFRWTDAVCRDGRRTSLRFVEDEDIEEDKPLDLARGETVSLPFGIYFRDFGWPHDGVDQTLALTNHSFKKSGFITYADFEINTGSKRFATTEDAEGTDLQAVMTHEAGHYIGLAHSREPQSIMAESYCDTGDKRCDHGKVVARRLAEDDIEAVCTLYPPSGLPPEEVALADKPSASCASSPSAPESAMKEVAALVLALAPIALWRSRRRRR